MNLTKLLLLTLGLATCARAFAQGTTFTYQGRLNDGSGSANGIHDVRFGLFSASSGGTQTGGAITNTKTQIKR